MDYVIDVNIPVLGEMHQLKATRGSRFNDLFDDICTKLDIKERQWYGFKYPRNKTMFEKKTKYKWLKGTTRVGKVRITPGDERMTLELAIRFYPRDMEAQVNDEFTIRFFYHQVRLDLVKNSSKITDPVDDLIHLTVVGNELEPGARVISQSVK